MTKGARHIRINRCRSHFFRRVSERLGGSIDPEALWQIIRIQIDRNDSHYLKFVVRLNRSERRLWRIEIEGFRFFVVYDHRLDCPVTVLTGGWIKPQSKPRINLDLQL